MRTPGVLIAALLISLIVTGGRLLGQSPSPAVPTAPSLADPANNTGWTVSPDTVDVTRPRSSSHPARLSNLSIRAVAGGATRPLVAGAVIQGTGALPVLVRAIGPGLRQFGLANNLGNPSLELFRGTASAAKSATFASDSTIASAYVGTFPMVNGDAALLGLADVGALTARCTSSAGTEGVALLEFYDATATPSAGTARFVNFSSRAQVETGDGLVVIGFVIAGEGEIRLLLRGIGPTLGQFNVADVLADPAIELYAGATRIASNDDWRSGGAAAATVLQDTARAVGAFDLASPSEAALVVSLRAGTYSLLVHGAPGQSGVALAEIYEVPAAPAGFDIGRCINAAGMDLYRQVAAAAAGQNLAVSPYSIQSALAMAYTGAAGDTRTEMARVLGFPDDNSALQSGLSDVRTSLDAIAAQSVPLAQSRSTPSVQVTPIEWQAANRLFGQQDYPFRDTFLAAMNDGFSAPLQLVDFALHSEAARVTINNWVAAQTNQKITDLIPAGGVDDSTRLTLVNAIYLKASWDSPFLASDTAALPFHPAPDASLNVPTMYKSASLGYSAEDGMTVVTLDYLGKGLQFVIVLPDAGQTLEAAATRITPEQFARWAMLDDTNRRDVVLYLPKFKIQGSTVDLTNALQSLGMSTAFDLPPLSANFDGIAPRHLPFDYLYISRVFHKTFVVVDESGTEAAAATAVAISTATSVVVNPFPPVIVRVDRPFLFAIQHRASGACLFIGRIANPQ